MVSNKNDVDREKDQAKLIIHTNKKIEKRAVSYYRNFNKKTLSIFAALIEIHLPSLDPWRLCQVISGKITIAEFLKIVEELEKNYNKKGEKS